MTTRVRICRAPSKDLGLDAHGLVSLASYLFEQTTKYISPRTIWYVFPFSFTQKENKIEEEEWKSWCFEALENANKHLGRLLYNKNSADHLEICRIRCSSLAVFRSLGSMEGPMSKKFAQLWCSSLLIHIVFAF
jgi:hypothetical protein